MKQTFISFFFICQNVQNCKLHNDAKILNFFYDLLHFKGKKNFALVYFQCQSILDVEGGIKNNNRKKMQQRT